jgi:hypothetical protein
LKREETRLEAHFTDEPRQEHYATLLRSLLPHADTVLLVAREQLKVNEAAKAVFRQLLPFRAKRVRVMAWPGTELIGHYAHVNYYPATPAVVTVLTASVEGLFQWKQPERPEDLCFLSKGVVPVLTTVAHEGMAWLNLPEQALTDVRTAVGRRFIGEPVRRPTKRSS